MPKPVSWITVEFPVSGKTAQREEELEDGLSALQRILQTCMLFLGMCSSRRCKYGTRKADVKLQPPVEEQKGCVTLEHIHQFKNLSCTYITPSLHPLHPPSSFHAFCSWPEVGFRVERLVVAVLSGVS
jgi:hypothetical protein